MTRYLFSDNCGFLNVAHPLWQQDGSVVYSHNCIWALPEQSLSGPRPAELSTIFYCIIWDSPNLEGQGPVLVSPGNRSAQLYPWALGSLLSPLTTRWATVYSYIKIKVKVTLRPIVSRPVRPGVRHPSGTRDQFFPFSHWLFLNTCGFVDVGRPLWRGVGFVVFSFCRASAAQRFSDFCPKSKSKSCYDWRSVSQSVSMSWCWVHSRTCDQMLQFCETLAKVWLLWQGPEAV
jgi:hypothetical protein